MEGFGGDQPERQEGFADWVAYKLTELAGYEIHELFNGIPSDPYYSGMKKFEIIEERYGQNGVIRAAKCNRLNLNALRLPGTTISRMFHSSKNIRINSHGTSSFSSYKTQYPLL